MFGYNVKITIGGIFKSIDEIKALAEALDSEQAPRVQHGGKAITWSYLCEYYPECLDVYYDDLDANNLLLIPLSLRNLNIAYDMEIAWSVFLPGEKIKWRPGMKESVRCYLRSNGEPMIRPDDLRLLLSKRNVDTLKAGIRNLIDPFENVPDLPEYSFCPEDKIQI